MAGRVTKDGGYVYTRPATVTTYRDASCDDTGLVVETGGCRYVIVAKRTRFAGYYEAAVMCDDGTLGKLVPIRVGEKALKAATPHRFEGRY